MRVVTVLPGDQRPLAEVLAELECSHGRVDMAQGGHTVAALVSVFPCLGRERRNCQGGLRP